MRVAVFGAAGGIGSSIAFSLCMRLPGAEIVLVDTNTTMAESHAMDLLDVLALGEASTVRLGTAVDAVDADVVVISAGVALHSMPSRAEFLDANAAIVAEVADPLAAAGWRGSMLIMTNPVDALVTWVQRRTGMDRHRIIGYTLNDTLRLRTAIASQLNVHPASVDAWVLGEHGGKHLPVFSRVIVEGRPVELDAAQREAARDYVDGWFARHARLDVRRSSAWTSGAGGAELVDAIVSGKPSPLPGSIVLEGEYGISGAAVSVPLVFDPAGGARVIEWTLSAEESSALSNAARRVVATADQVGSGLPVSEWRLG